MPLIGLQMQGLGRSITQPGGRACGTSVRSAANYGGERCGAAAKLHAVNVGTLEEENTGRLSAVTPALMELPAKALTGRARYAAWPAARRFRTLHPPPPPAIS
jgi:hypothetical protein